MKLSDFEAVEAARERLMEVLVALEKIDNPDSLGLMVVDSKNQRLLEDNWMDGAGEVQLKAWNTIREGVRLSLDFRVKELTAELESFGVKVDLAKFKEIYVTAASRAW